MRIVAGKYGGRRLITPKGDAIRPTSDKVRLAIFNMLRSRGVLQGAHVIDAFCGTGALGLEALSQGAETAVFMDKVRDALALAKENAAALKMGTEAVFILNDATKMGLRPQDIQPRDLVFLDPPYRKNLVPLAMEALIQGDWLASEAFCVIEVEKDFAAAFSENVAVKNERNYGDTKLILATALSR